MVPKVTFPVDENIMTGNIANDPWLEKWSFGGEPGAAVRALETFGGTLREVDGVKYLDLSIERLKFDGIEKAESPDTEIIVLRSLDDDCFAIYGEATNYLVLIREAGLSDRYTWGFRDRMPLNA